MLATVLLWSPRAWPTVAVLLALALALGCSNYVKRGSTLYADGRYVEAAEVFERTEHRLKDATPREGAEYGLYRGLTLLRLGDPRNAHRWLTYAYMVEREFPGSLRGNRRSMLDQGWRELGERMNAAPSTPAKSAQPGTAVAASEPPPPPPAPQPAPEADAPAPDSERALVPH
jgi:tetratricopeptide (TPR) repeat protein